MSFLLPFRKGDSPPKKDPDIEAQVGSSSASRKDHPLDNKDHDNDTDNDATALQVLDEASFIAPQNPLPLEQSSTLIPYPLAKLVSATTGLGTLTVRSYARAFGWGLVLGRETTLRSLEITRAGIEILLRSAAKDVSSRRDNDSELARADTESVLARSISALHWAFTGAAFATAASFNLTETYLQGIEGVALQGLSTLNALLGSTESSRAVSAIITLIKEELTRPGAEDGLVPSYWDLIIGCVGFIILQRWGRRKTALQFRGNGGEETIWDLVIDDKGFRADVVGTKRDGGDEVTATNYLTTARAVGQGIDDGALELERGLELDIPPSITLTAQDQTRLSDDEIRDKILAQLPSGTRAVITSNTLTLKTIQVDIHGAETAHIEPPPGLTMVSERLSGQSEESGSPRQTIIFRTSLKRSSSADIELIDRLRMTGAEQESYDYNDTDETELIMSSPKRRKSFSSSPGRSSTEYSRNEKPILRSSDERDNFTGNQKQVQRAAKSDPSNSVENFSKLSIRTKKDRDKTKNEKAGIIKKALQSLSPTPSAQKQQIQRSTTPPRKDTSMFSGIGPLSRITDSDQNKTKRVFSVSEDMAQSPINGPELPPPTTRPSATSFFTMHEKKRESTVSQTDSFSIHSSDSRPSSPSSYRTHARADSGLTKTKSHSEIMMYPNVRGEVEDSSSKHHYRSRSFVPSLYSMASKHSNEAIILQPKTPVHRSIFEDHKMLTALTNDGKVPGMFPDRHLVKSIRRFARFASASYGSNFLRMMGITNPQTPPSDTTELVVKDIHHEHSSFATHTGLPADTILLSGFCDPKGGHIAVSKNQPIMTPLMHFISIDHDSKAVVLTCRGTWGFEDVLTDMTCDYDDFYWQGGLYQVHKGIHASARRLLDGGGRRVISTIKTSLEEYPDYGLVLCGHSLGGSVAAVLALLISEPNKKRPMFDSGEDAEAGPSFVTAAPQKLLTGPGGRVPYAPPVTLPAGRPIHVFAYGPPPVFSHTLRLATRGLVTTIVNNNDIVPTLSLGNLHDFKAVAVHLKQDPSSPLVKMKSSMIERVKHAMLGSFWNRESTPPRPVPSSGISPGEDEEEWQWTALTTLRNLMINDKLLPPGEVFVIETSRVFDRFATDPEFSSIPGTTPGDSAYRPLGRPATRVQFKLIRNVESRFREIRFGSGMYGDHIPGRYEGGLEALERGIFEEL